jgi:hypothetical protein
LAIWRRGRDHLHRITEAELAQIGDLAADVVHRVAEDRRLRGDQFYWVSEAKLAKVGQLASHTADRVAQDCRKRCDHLDRVGEA